MFRSGKFAACALILLAGCSTAPRRTDNSSATRTNFFEELKLLTNHVAASPVLAPPPAGPPINRPAGKWISFERWSHEHDAGSIRRISLAPLPTFALASSNNLLVLQANNRVAKWNGIELHLGFVPEVIGGNIFVQALDVEKNIEPLLQDFSLPAGTRRVIVIDPGHGGAELGAKSVLDGRYEKEFTLDWARRLAPLLEAEGWRVFLTRTGDSEISLSNRVAFAAAHRADLFISLHFNSAAPDEKPLGLETFCLTPMGMASTLTRGYDDDSTAAFPNNAFDAENLQLAARLQRALLKIPGVLDQGVRRARFMSVLRGQVCPAVLVEGGFLSNPREARRIADPAFRQKLAEALAGALKPQSPTRDIQTAAAPANNDSAR